MPVGGEGRTRVLSANDLQSHRLPSRPTGQASRRPGHRSQRRGPDREVSTEVRGFTLIISKASNRFVLTAASARVPISRIDNRNTRTRTRICFDNPFFDYLTCLLIILLSTTVNKALHYQIYILIYNIKYHSYRLRSIAILIAATSTSRYHVTQRLDDIVHKRTIHM